MAIVMGSARDLPAVQEMFRHGAHWVKQFGDEDLPRMTLLVGQEAGEYWGAVAVHVEDRPATLPAAAADRLYARGVAIGRRGAPSRDAAELLSAATRLLRQEGRVRQLILHTDQRWLMVAAVDGGFSLVDRVDYFRRSGSHVPRLERIPVAGVTLQVAGPEDLPDLARLDAVAFDPLWHMGEAELASLFFNGRLCLARLEEEVIGYAALSLLDPGGESGPAGGSGGGIGFLARLAVHPAFQGLGIGRHLLVDSLQAGYAHGVGQFMLNTQASNEPSRRLYARLGFRPAGQSFSVYAMQF